MHFVLPDRGQEPDLRHEAYGSTRRRAPSHPATPVALPEGSEAPVAVPPALLTPRDADLTAWGSAPPLGERIVVAGRVTDEDGRPVARSLIEVWQCNAAGRYAHPGDQHDAPLDPHFVGHGRLLTDDDGCYRFDSIKPGAYPWGNHRNAWRPAHIHFSLFGNVYAQRLVTQMYFPGDPLFEFDPIFNSIPDAAARQRLVARFSLDHTVEGRALGYAFDIVLRGRHATPMDP